MGSSVGIEKFKDCSSQKYGEGDVAARKRRWHKNGRTVQEELPF